MMMMMMMMMMTKMILAALVLFAASEASIVLQPGRDRTGWNQREKYSFFLLNIKYPLSLA